MRNDTNRPNQMGFEFKKMDNLIARHIHAELARKGFDEITTMHGWMLGFIYRNSDRDVYQKDFEEIFEISKSTVTNILKLMEKKGYITRTSQDTDARLKKIELTEKGLKVHMETVKVIDRFHEQIELGITEEERKVFYQVVRKMKDNINNSQEDTNA